MGTLTLKLTLHNGTREGQAGFDEDSGRRMLTWDNGECWVLLSQQDAAAYAKTTSALVNTVRTKVLPFQEQLDLFPGRGSDSCRTFASGMLILFFCWYFGYSMYKIAQPNKYYEHETGMRYWGKGDEELPSIAFDQGRLPAGSRLVATVTDMNNRGERATKTFDLITCKVRQRGRDVDNALCFPEKPRVIGTFGDERYIYARINVLVPITSFYSNSTKQPAFSVYHFQHNTQYARFIESLYFTYARGVRHTNVRELYFDKITIRNGTAAGIFEALGFESYLRKETVLSYKGEDNRYENLQFSRDGTMAVVLKIYMRASQSQIDSFYQPDSFILFFEKAGSLWASFGFLVTATLLSTLIVPRICQKCSRLFKKKRRSTRLSRSTSRPVDG